MQRSLSVMISRPQSLAEQRFAGLLYPGHAYGRYAPTPAIKEQSVVLPPPRAAGQIVADIPTLVKKLADEAKVL